MQNLSPKRLAVITAGTALMFLAWDASGFDLPMAHWFGGLGGFPLQDNWFLTTVLHDGARRLAWCLALLLCLGVWFPLGGLERLTFNRRLQFALTTLLAVTVVSSLKLVSATSCPYALSDFGGVAHYTSHWAHLFQHDGGSGGCFPAGHASSGFAFLGGYFAFRGSDKAVAQKWLAGAIMVGLVLGFAQQLRGAHFMSHTLWTAWICWCTAWGVDKLMDRFTFVDVKADLGAAA
ncbi:Membrane-associated enzyme, PAP2 (acid phosphatase) superfamily [Polaromonas sp. YR568]|uniref:phosphatase PAP2 family protein n=1 Tax=Polaromonas sp. YR568 TaxID=1855301 RepID=UPI0008DF9D61|nr:phosphatase PAP2 family protein [Polaromonas sp. YR568]SFU87960.1 Membrane-associated enzyme, PAP2 (acid phosphatase) superfamily [Polaromonas sp. YR568]